MQILDLILDEITGVVGQVDEEQFDRFMDYVKPGVRVFVLGEGRSGFTARGFAMRMMHIGYDAHFVGETTTPSLKEGDVFVAVSGSGTSAHVLVDAQKAKKLGCVVLAVSSKADSPLGELADMTLVIPGTVKGEQGAARKSAQLLSSLFDQSLHVVLDGLCLAVSRRDGKSNDAATKAHW